MKRPPRCEATVGPHKEAQPPDDARSYTYVRPYVWDPWSGPRRCKKRAKDLVPVNGMLMCTSHARKLGQRRW